MTERYTDRKNEEIKVVIAGIGPGGTEMVTEEVLRAFLESNVILGAGRIIDALQAVSCCAANGFLPVGRVVDELLDAPDNPFFIDSKIYIKEYQAEKVAEYIESDMARSETTESEDTMESDTKDSGARRYFAAVSGDSGFFSAASGIRAALDSRGIPSVTLPGISSLSFLCAKAGVSWEDAVCVSAHGRELNIASAVRRNKKTFVLTAGNTSMLLRRLTEFGLGEVSVFAGEGLSYQYEKISQGTASELADQSFSMPCSLLILNENASDHVRWGIPDDEFIRGNVPMTKRETRLMTMSCLDLKSDSVVFDIGAGTGSVSIEAALTAHRGKIFSVERNPEAAALLRQNCRKFHTDNVEIIEGRAPEALKDLPVDQADTLFIGGSAGKMEHILAVFCQPDRKKPLRIAANAVTLETIGSTLSLFEKYGAEEIEAVQISAVRTKTAGKYHMMDPQTPVFVISGVFPDPSGDGSGSMLKIPESDRKNGLKPDPKKKAESGSDKPPAGLSEDTKTQTLNLPPHRIVIGGTGSGCGKTTVTSGLLWCLKRRGWKPAAFKCGPDYIDPMFHEKVLGAKSQNLDLFFSDPETARFLAASASSECDICVAEGVMGYYDGIGMTPEASTWKVAEALDAPSVLVINARGMASSALAVLQGFAEREKNSRIRGVIFNRLPEKLYGRLAEQVRQMGIEPLGYLPPDGRMALESRHLGLVTAGEIRDLQEKMDIIGQWMEKTVDIDGLLRLAEEAGPGEVSVPAAIAGIAAPPDETKPRIAVASDEAFCFTYSSNLMLLEQMGAELVFFSPLHDRELPGDIDGLLLSGGYPELYGQKLEENAGLRESVRRAVRQGIPVVAECGGFMYLHRRLEDADGSGKMYEMAGVIDGDCFKGKKLGNFGYLYLTAREDGMLAETGEKLKAHEFHYWKSTAEGDAFRAEKADGSRSWAAGFSLENMYAGFPHLFFCSSPRTAERFVEKCRSWREERKTQPAE